MEGVASAEDSGAESAVRVGEAKVRRGSSKARRGRESLIACAACESG